MRNAKLTILAALSLVTLAMLAWGYVGRLGLSIAYVSPRPPVRWSGGLRYCVTNRAAGANVSRGHVVISWGHYLMLQNYSLSPGLHVTPYYDFKRSLPRDWFWDFHINRDDRVPDSWGVTLECPLWFAAIPFTIAPIAWLRRRRRRETRGFAVEGGQARQPSEPASKPPNQPPELPTDPQTPAGV